MHPIPTGTGWIIVDYIANDPTPSWIGFLRPLSKEKWRFIFLQHQGNAAAIVKENRGMF